MWVAKDEYCGLLRMAAERRIEVEQLQYRLIDAKQQIADLRHEVELEKGRANQAVDAMLSVHGAPPITPTELPDPSKLFEEDPEEAERMARAIAENGLLSVLDEAR